MQFMNWIAGYIGWSVCLLAGIVATSFLVGVVTDYAWLKIKSAHDLLEIKREVKAHKKRRISVAKEE
ncbi:TPA: hypothetical protein ACN7P9_002962 [Klebsiella pneumoniae]